MLLLSGWTRALLYACIIVSALQSPICVLFYMRRHRTPIRERMPLVAIVEYLFFSLHMSLTLLAIVFPRYCFAVLIMLNYAGGISLTASVLRYLGLYLTYRFNRAKIFTGSSIPFFSDVPHMVPIGGMTSLDRWLLRNKWVLTWRFQLPYFLVVIMLVTSFNILLGLMPSTWENFPCARPGDIAATIMQFWYLFWALILAYLVVLMRIVVDAFNIKWELLFYLRFVMLQIVLWLIPPLNDYDQTQYPVFALVYFAVVQVRWAVSMILPIRWSYQSYRLLDRSTLTVRQIMERPNMLDAFHQFLITEFCIENLYFLLAVHQFRQLRRSTMSKAAIAMNPTAAAAASAAGRISLNNFRRDYIEHDEGIVQNRVNEIYDMFCDRSSAFAINISSQQLDRIEQGLDDGDVNIFNDAVLEIEKLLEQGSLPRFFASDLGRQWCTSA